LQACLRPKTDQRSAAHLSTCVYVTSLGWVFDALRPTIDLPGPTSRTIQILSTLQQNIAAACARPNATPHCRKPARTEAATAELQRVDWRTQSRRLQSRNSTVVQYASTPDPDRLIARDSRLVFSFSALLDVPLALATCFNLLFLLVDCRTCRLSIL
jgi:hypothetical protein